MTETWVFDFEQADKGNKDLLGGKGANLANMTQLGLPVPPGFTITTRACNAYSDNGKFPEGLWEQVKASVSRLESKTGKQFGGADTPLLVSVRSGAKFSMPGMMDTILNLGTNDQTAAAVEQRTSNPRFARDSYRRLIQTFADVAMGVELHHFEEELIRVRGEREDYEISAEELQGLITTYKSIYKAHTGADFPQDPYEQLRLAVEAVFKSWNNPRAQTYRRESNIPDDIGTACNVQSMVFGNMGMTSGTGVCFSRNPATGSKGVYGEFLINAQGEDVVAGIRTPENIDKLSAEMPEVAKQLFETIDQLEKHFRDMQDIEFTVEEGKLFILQTRGGKRTGMAAVNIAVDMVEEGLVDRERALLMVEPQHVDQLLHPQIDPKDAERVGALDSGGLPASPGAAVGKIVLSSTKAVEIVNAAKAAGNKERLVLVSTETTPDDIDGMIVCEGILTARGGMTSHAAVVARGMGKPCVASLPSLHIGKDGTVRIGNQTFAEGDAITIDGGRGAVYPGELKLTNPTFAGKIESLLQWADDVRRLKVRTNADNPHDSAQAVEFGAEGIGLCRTEHMFFEPERLPHVRAMILSDTEEERRQHLGKIYGFQKGDFLGIFKVMSGKPVTIRLLDPPLHEFLPHDDAEIDEMIEEVFGSVDDKRRAQIHHRIHAMHESNPMLGFRGCRLGIIYPEINEMQVKAIIAAAIEAQQAGSQVLPEIMVPLIGSVRELKLVEPLLRRVAERTMEEYGVHIPYMFGTMIEVPRACVTADEIAEVAEFFSFGTNDLTQMGMGVSRDDAQRFLQPYVEMGIYDEDPFNSLDREGIGKLVEIAVKQGREARPGLKVGICGEHGGDPRSIEFFHRAGLDYVSCSPFRVPIARLAAAQAEIQNRGKEALVGQA
ncbi:MAG: pyruvate, phosphate dikinase [bacterium]|nr:pyruvate, phosphate dikinase [bacterium]